MKCESCICKVSQDTASRRDAEAAEESLDRIYRIDRIKKGAER